MRYFICNIEVTLALQLTTKFPFFFVVSNYEAEAKRQAPESRTSCIGIPKAFAYKDEIRRSIFEFIFLLKVCIAIKKNTKQRERDTISR